MPGCYGLVQAMNGSRRHAIPYAQGHVNKFVLLTPGTDRSRSIPDPGDDDGRNSSGHTRSRKEKSEYPVTAAF